MYFSGKLRYAIITLLPLAGQATAFGLSDVTAEAQALAKKNYQAPDTTLPAVLDKLDYDQYRDIRYRPEHRLWHAEHLPFEVAFFHRGGFFHETASMAEIDGNTVRPLHFDPAAFDYGKNRIDKAALNDLGLAGLRVHYPVNGTKYMDEALVFLGASYFRALGAGQRYGSSARGLAIDTGLSSGEEFPRFCKFWIERPPPGAGHLTLYALLDSPRATGAYRFVLAPGQETTLEVDATLFLRAPVGTLGLAPLTSMYLFGGNQHPSRDDYRPEVHDADGLSLHSGSGEWLWRPLVNPGQLLMSSFADTNPVGFGLMQRQQDPHMYDDVEAHYELRPSVWVEPIGAWGRGRVELVEIPVPDETHDNIVAYWVPAEAPTPGQPFHLGYRLHWQHRAATLPPQAWVSQTRRGKAFQLHPDDSIGFLVDFQGPALRGLPPGSRFEPAVTVDGNAELLESGAYSNDIDGGVRLALRIHRRDPGKPVELRAFLRHDHNTVSETWTYLLPPG